MSKHIAIHVVNLQPLKENDIDVHPLFKVLRFLRVMKLISNIFIIEITDKPAERK